MKFLAALTLVGCVAAQSFAEEPPLLRLTDLGRPGPGANGNLVRVRGSVTYCDPASAYMVIQDGDRGVGVRIPVETTALRTGQRVELNGRPRGEHFFDASAVRVIDEDRPLAPIELTGDEFAIPNENPRRVAVRGVIRATNREGGRLVLYLRAGNHRFRVYVRESPGGPEAWERLIDSDVRVVGVAVALFDQAPKKRPIGNKLVVHRIDDIEVVRPGPTRPFALPLTPGSAIPAASEHRIRVRGQATGPVVEGNLELNVDDTKVRVPVGADYVARADQPFEVVGFPTRQDGRVVLEDAVVRGFAPRVDAEDSELVPVLTTVAEVRRLTKTEAERKLPVRLRATVTYHQPSSSVLFVHDGREGIYVMQWPASERMASGTVVEIDGFTDPGEFAPIIYASRIVTLREGDLPADVRLGYSDMVGGRADSQWVSFEAVVRAVGHRPGEGVLTLRFGPATVEAIFPGIGEAELRGFLGATVRIRGVCGSSFNRSRQWENLNFCVPSTSFVEIRKPGPNDPFDVPARTVANLSHFDADRDVSEPIKLRGTIISRRGTSCVIQDETGGVLSELQSQQPGDVGECVEVRGYLTHRGSGWAIEEGLIRLAPEGPTPQPIDAIPQEIALNRHDSMLIRIEGTVVDHFPAGAGDHAILLRADDLGGPQILFPVILPRSELTPELAALKPGTRLRIVGACSVPTDHLLISSFRILLRDASDVEIVERPPWWTTSRAWTLVGGLLACAVIAFVWVYTLRRRLRKKTAEVRARLEREADLEAKYRELVETASDVVFTLDAAGHVSSINQAGRRLTGLSEGQSFIHRVTASSLPDAHDLAACEAPISREVGLAGSSGAVLLEVNARPVVHDGQWLGIQAIARDLTQRRRLEDELRQSQKMEAIGRLAGGVAHDFNNLLTVINGNAEVLQARSDHSSAELAGEIVRAGEQAAGLTRQLLAFSRKGVVSPKVICPNDVLQSAQRMFARLVGERVDVITDLDPDIGCIKIDPGQLEQALLNLAVNARDAMGASGTLTFRTRAWIGHARIEVCDTGHGMDDETRSRAFEPFFTTKPAGEGTGLGLATVRSIIDQAGGRICVHSQSGRGAKFILDFPLSGESPALADPAPSLAHPDNNRETILLVEDEPAVQLLERRVLEMGKYTVLVASTGAEALRLLDEHADEIDLLLTDVVMPGMCGRELAERAAARRPGLPALFLSGYTPDEVLRQGVQAEAAWFLQKPFTPSSLLTKVREVLAHEDSIRAGTAETVRSLSESAHIDSRLASVS